MKPTIRIHHLLYHTSIHGFRSLGKTEDAQEKGAEENIWTDDGWSNRKLDKTA
jgi:hypothetical protein